MKMIIIIMLRHLLAEESKAKFERLVMWCREQSTGDAIKHLKIFAKYCKIFSKYCKIF